MSSPLTGPPPPEVPLQNAPLARVIAQVRFPPIVSIEQRSFVAAFQEAIRGEYAIMREGAANRAQVRFPGHPGLEVSTDRTWLFHDLAHPWRAVLSANYIALETNAYTSRVDFIGRLGRLVDALGRTAQLRAIDRVGVRYLDRLTGASLDAVDRLVQPAMLGVMRTPVGARAVVCASEVHLTLPEERGGLRCRWGWLPPGAALDQTGLDPVAEPSWVLDIDAFCEGERVFDARAVHEEARALSERAYAFFRWSVTDAFLTRFGGTP